MKKMSRYYENLAEMANSIILLMSPAGKIGYINTYGAEFFGFTKDELTGRNILDTIVPETDSAGRKQSELMKSICRNPESYIRNENENMLRTGERVWIAWTNKALRGNNGRPQEILCVGNDITVRKMMEKELQQARMDLEERVRERTAKLNEAYEDLRLLMVRLAVAEESEKKRISREIHDQIGQNLSAIGLNLNLVRSAMSEKSFRTAKTIIDDSLVLLKETTRRVRHILDELRLPVLDDYGLLAALQWYSRRFTERTGIEAVVEGDEIVPRPPAHEESALFLIAREALANVAKHSRASRVVIRLKVNNNILYLSVTDNGIGHKVLKGSKKQPQKGMGLLSMNERAFLAGGLCTVSSQPGTGTSVIVEVPL